MRHDMPNITRNSTAIMRTLTGAVLASGRRWVKRGGGTAEMLAALARHHAPAARAPAPHGHLMLEQDPLQVIGGPRALEQHQIAGPELPAKVLARIAHGREQRDACAP